MSGVDAANGGTLVNDRLNAVAEIVKGATQDAIRGSRRVVEATVSGLRTHRSGAVRLIKSRLDGRTQSRAGGSPPAAPQKVRPSKPATKTTSAGSTPAPGPDQVAAPASADRPAAGPAAAAKKTAKTASPAKKAAAPAKKAAKKAATNATPAKKAAPPAKKAAPPAEKAAPPAKTADQTSAEAPGKTASAPAPKGPPS